MSTKNTYRIATDGFVVDIEAGSADEALSKTNGIPSHVTTPSDFQRWLRDEGGFGSITENGIPIARVMQ